MYWSIRPPVCANAVPGIASAAPATAVTKVRRIFPLPRSTRRLMIPAVLRRTKRAANHPQWSQGIDFLLKLP